eukprot:GHUV01023520.1.p1 GENE.GHUV01023520.1~~GHUV01023520.1.p1  ORF type:complete len:503 (-),score=119.73 GHUV01023520.1:325-1833(-)
MLHRPSSAVQGRCAASKNMLAARSALASRRMAVAVRAATTTTTTVKPSVDTTGKPAPTPPTVLWGARMTSTTPLVGDTATKLMIKLVDASTDERTKAYSIDDWEPPQEIMIDGGKGWTRCGVIRVPDQLTAPSAVTVQKIDTNPADGHSLDYISEIELTSPYDGVHRIPVHSWVSSCHGERVFFEGTPYLPKDTPPQIKDEREEELKALRGQGGASSESRTYDYQVYDDLGPNRPNLGGSTALPYPRRLKSKGPGKDNLPFDEQFNYSKQAGFTGDTLAGVAVAFTKTISASSGVEAQWYNVLPIAAVEIAKKKLGVTSKAPEFKRYEDVSKLYQEPGKVTEDILSKGDADAINDVTAQKELGLIAASARGKPFALQQKEKQARSGVAGAAAAAAAAFSEKLPTASFGEIFQRAIGTLKGDAKSNVLDINELLAYKIPKVESGRAGQWASDLEFGRQTLAGMNPCMLSALKQMPEAIGSAIGPQHVDGELLIAMSARVLPCK